MIYMWILLGWLAVLSVGAMLYPTAGRYARWSHNRRNARLAKTNRDFYCTCRTCSDGVTWERGVVR